MRVSAGCADRAVVPETGSSQDGPAAVGVGRWAAPRVRRPLRCRPAYPGGLLEPGAGWRTSAHGASISTMGTSEVTATRRASDQPVEEADRARQHVAHGCPAHRDRSTLDPDEMDADHRRRGHRDETEDSPAYRKIHAPPLRRPLRLDRWWGRCRSVGLQGEAAAPVRDIGQGEGQQQAPQHPGRGGGDRPEDAGWRKRGPGEVPQGVGLPGDPGGDMAPPARPGCWPPHAAARTNRGRPRRPGPRRPRVGRASRMAGCCSPRGRAQESAPARISHVHAIRLLVGVAVVHRDPGTRAEYGANHTQPGGDFHNGARSAAAAHAAQPARSCRRPSTARPSGSPRTGANSPMRSTSATMIVLEPAQREVQGNDHGKGEPLSPPRRRDIADIRRIPTVRDDRRLRTTTT